MARTVVAAETPLTVGSAVRAVPVVPVAAQPLQVSTVMAVLAARVARAVTPGTAATALMALTLVRPALTAWPAVPAATAAPVVTPERAVPEVPRVGPPVQLVPTRLMAPQEKAVMPVKAVRAERVPTASAP